MLSTRDQLTLLITNTSHKAHLLSCAERCSSELQKIQSLENFVSIAIQGIQVPMYTKHTLFFYFYDFSIFLFLYEKKKLKTTKNVLNKAKHKTRLTQNLKAKHISNANTKTRKEKEK